MRLSPFRLGGTVVALLIAWVTVGGIALAGKVAPDAALVGTYWRAMVIDGVPVSLAPRQREPHFVLAAPGNRVHGSTGCNQLMGAFEQTDSGLCFKGLATTRRACPPPVSAMEKAFLRALEATAAYRISGDSLDLLDAAGQIRMRLEARYLR